MPATPGWVSSELDQVLGALPNEAAFVQARGDYAECLAGCAGDEPQLKRDHCRQVFLERLSDLGTVAGTLTAIGSRLEALEAEIDERT